MNPNGVISEGLQFKPYRDQIGGEIYKNKMKTFYTLTDTGVNVKLSTKAFHPRIENSWLNELLEKD